MGRIRDVELGRNEGEGRGRNRRDRVVRDGLGTGKCPNHREAVGPHGFHGVGVGVESVNDCPVVQRFIPLKDVPGTDGRADGFGVGDVGAGRLAGGKGDVGNIGRPGPA